MAYNELIKNFERIRDYMREFYVYGFKSREEYQQKSARSYDDERRRIESWLSDYMGFRQTAGGKNVFISIDSRSVSHNPLYKAWKAKSFTDGDITLHFIIFDILASEERAFSLNEIMTAIDDYLKDFSAPMVFDASTVRKKLNEYIKEGLITSEKLGKTAMYRVSPKTGAMNRDALDFFSETAPCGVIGSTMLEDEKSEFCFKHHYITQALDSDILVKVFDAISREEDMIISIIRRDHGGIVKEKIVPLQVYISVQNGRQYIMAYEQLSKRIRPYRLDNIIAAELGEACFNYSELRKMHEGIKKNLWGVSTSGQTARTEKVSFTVKYSANEDFISKRLEREKRCGTVEKIDDETSVFTAEVYDSTELIPWIRTFICRISSIEFSNEEIDRQFKADIEKMYELYGIE